MSKRNRNQSDNKQPAATQSDDTAQSVPAETSASTEAAGGELAVDDASLEEELSVAISAGVDQAGGAAMVIPFVQPGDAVPVGLEPLVERLRAGKCVLWAGSGLDEAAGGVGYRGVVSRLLDTLPASEETQEARELLKRRPFLVAGFVRRRLGDGFAEALRKAATGPAELPTELRMLGELPFRAVVSTGYSNLIERAFTHDDQPLPVYTPANVAEAHAEKRGRYLLKALGDPTLPGTTVFSARELQEALGADRLALAVRDFHKNRSILFLGIDPAVDIDRLFVRLLQGAPSDGVEHYAVAHGLTHLEREELLATYRVKVVDAADAFALIRALRAAVGDLASLLPADDDLDGWLALLAEEPGRPDARQKIAAIEERLQAAGQSESLIELHLGMAELEATPDARARRLSEVARLFEEQGDAANAFAALLASYKEAPVAASAAGLDRLAAATSSWTELVAEFVALAPTLPEAGADGQSVRADHWVRTARLYHERLGHAEYALNAVDQALALRPDHAEGRALRVTALRQAERWPELAEALGQAASGEENAAQRAAMYLEQGDVSEARLGDHAGAARAYRAALAAVPGSAEALAALELLHRRREEWPELVAVLDEKIKHAQDGQAIALRQEAATLVGDKLSDRASAIARWEMLRLETEGTASLVALRALQPLYQAAGRTDDYLEALAAEAEATTDAAARTSLQRRLAAEWEARPDGLARAAAWLEKVLAVEPRNEAVLGEVERLYAAQEKWEALIDAYRRHVEVPGADRVALSSAIARTLAQHLQDAPRAVDAWEQVLALDPANAEALAALTTLHEKGERWDKALALYDRRAEQAKDKEQKVQLLYEGGRLAADHVGDVKLAEERYHRALEVDPAYVPAMTAMVEIYRKSGEFLRAAKLLIEAEAHTANRLEKTRLLVEAGEIYDELEQRVTATDLYLKALQVDPEHVEAGNRVSELLWQAERWAELVPVLEMLTRKEADRATQKQRWVRLGRAARALNFTEKASRAYARATELDPNDVEVQRASGDLLFAEGKWAEALEAFKAVLAYAGDELADADRVELYFRLGECDRQLGQIDKARNFYAKALEIDPTHRPSILARIDVDGDDPKSIIAAKRALLATASDDEKVKLLTEIGDLSLEKLSDTDAALAVYGEALAVRADSRSLLHKCLEIHVQRKDWPRALEALARLTELEQVASVRARLRYTRAVIQLDEMHDAAAAIELLTEAEGDDPLPRITQKLEELLVQNERWKELQRFYRRVIKRFPEAAETDTPEQRTERQRVWGALADVSLHKLGEAALGLQALEVTVAFDKDNVARNEQLADLYVEAGPDFADKAIAAHQALLRLQHDRIPSYRALRQLYAAANQPEKALAVAYALSFLKKGAPEDEPMVAEAKRRPLQPARRHLDDEQWSRNLLHPDENRYVDALFTLLHEPLSVASGQPHKDVGLNRKDRVDTATDPRAFAKGLRYVGITLNVTLPYETYVRYEQREAMAIANCVDQKQAPVPCLVVGQPLLGDKRTERELVYELSKRLSYFRADRYLRFVLPQAAQLGVILDAAIGLGAEQGHDKAAMSPEATKVAADLKRALPPKTLEQVAHLGRNLRGPRGIELATGWLAATELTATRTAYLLVGDLETTARFAAAEPANVSTHPPLHRLKELIYFSITEECFALKKHLGLMP